MWRIRTKIGKLGCLTKTIFFVWLYIFGLKKYVNPIMYWTNFIQIMSIFQLKRHLSCQIFMLGYLCDKYILMRAGTYNNKIEKLQILCTQKSFVLFVCLIGFDCLSYYGRGHVTTRPSSSRREVCCVTAFDTYCRRGEPLYWNFRNWISSCHPFCEITLRDRKKCVDNSIFNHE